MTEGKALKEAQTIAAVAPKASSRGPYGGYHKRAVPAEDAELTHSGPGTPCGEFMRRFWQPVALSQELKDLPVALNVLGEELVAFRDLAGRVGVLHRHCAHRGASLEFGKIADRGLRCCYHGWLFDVDGTILDTPGEPETSRIKDTNCQGAYPAVEAAGLVFAYMGPPELKPAFPLYDTLNLPGTRLVPYALSHPCNWLQVHENLMDPLHAVFLHSRMGSTQITAAWGEMPVTEWGVLGDRMYYLTSRRLGDHVWVRFNEVITPNFGQVGGFWEHGDREQLFVRVSATRWTVPNDDRSSTIFGVRHFSDEVEPPGIGQGNPDEVGREKLDVYGQTSARPYEEMQRNPGDWEAMVSQRPIAVHALETRGSTDAGVAMLRRQLRRAIRQVAEGQSHQPLRTASADGTVPTWTSNTILRIPERAGVDDRAVLREVGRRVRDAVIAADELAGPARLTKIRTGLATIPGELLAFNTPQAVE